MKKLFTLSAILRKESAGQILQLLKQGYRLTETREEALGSFLLECLKNPNGFAISQMDDVEIDPADVALIVKQQIERQQNEQR